MRILIALLLQASSMGDTPVQASELQSELRFDLCIKLSIENPAKAIDMANSWRLAGGGVPARHCLALAYARDQRWASAATAFEQAARESEIANDGRAANLWVQAGNAHLAAQQFPAARAALDAAISSGLLEKEMLGEAHLDRARARVALDDLPGGRSDLDKALALVPEDPLAWLLSATLARRAGDISRAQSDIDHALKIASDDASIALEAGNIAAVQGNGDAARKAWQGAIAVQPDSEAARAARTALDALDSAPSDMPDKPL